LILVATGTSSAGADFYTRFNSDSGSNYSRVLMYAPPATSLAQTSRSAVESSTGPTSLQPTFLQIMDYSATNKHKTVLQRQGLIATDSTFFVSASASRWANTAAITTVSLTTASGTFNAGFTFNLFGIAS
jgi:hypothetical protein